MNAQNRKLTTIIVVTIMLPLVMFFSNEISELNDSEEMIQQIYTEQLESVLFSVNQYSNDFMNALINKVESDFEKNDFELPEETVLALKQNGIQTFYILQVDLEEEKLIFPSNGEILVPDDWWQNPNWTLIKQGIGYFEAGYRKLETSLMIESEDGIFQTLSTILTADDQYYLFVGLIDPLYFIEEVLSPKMQQVGQEKLIITLQKKDNPDIVFTTDTLTNNILATRDMWLFPDMIVGVSPRNETVVELTQRRMKSNVIAILLLAFLLIIGIVLIARNLNKEVKLAQLKADFVSNVSHELRTPLSLISMFAETLMDGRVKTNEKKQSYYEIIHKETHRLANIVNRILNFSKIEAGKRIYQMAPLELNELVKEVLHDYSFHLTQKGFDLKSAFADQAIFIDGDREAIYEAIVNLIDNAIKYSDDVKSLKISTELNTDYGSILIQDQGIGIKKNKLKEIFDKFYRVADNNVYLVQGAGLGLSIVKHIMDAHEGLIDVRSTFGEGSTFILKFKTNQA